MLTPTPIFSAEVLNRVELYTSTYPKVHSSLYRETFTFTSKVLHFGYSFMYGNDNLDTSKSGSEIPWKF